MSRQAGDWINSYLDYTSDTEPRESYRRWCAVSAIASALQRKVFLPWGDMEVFYPNMYIVLVGPPAARKGTAMRPVEAMLANLGIITAGDETSRQYLIKILEEADQNSTDIDDGIVYNHSSISIISSELTVFLGMQNVGLLTVLCDLYDCKSSFKYSTHAHGDQIVTNVWVNLLGATTPTNIQTALPSDAICSGFTSRTVFVFEEGKSRIVVKPSLTERQKRLQEALIKDLNAINLMCGPFAHTQEFEDAYGEWRCNSEENPPFGEPKLEFYLQRRHVHLLKLSMIYSASRGEDKLVTIQDFNNARTSLESVEKKMPNVFRGVGANPLNVVQIRLMDMLPRRQRMKLSEITEIFCDDVDTRQLSMIIATLEQMRFAKLDLNTGVLHYLRRDKDGN